RRGELVPGAVVPSEHQLCAQYGVSVTTARRALLELTRQGLIYRQAGVGSFVADPARSARLCLVFAGFEPGLWRNSASSMGELIGGVSDTVWRRDCALELVRTDEPLGVELLAELIEQRKVDGLLVRLAGNVEEQAAFLEARAFPHVFVRRYESGRRMSAVVPAEDVAARLAVGHLARHGHGRIALISAMGDMVLTRDLVRGYRAAVAAHGLERAEGLVAIGDRYDAEQGWDLARGLLSLPRGRRPAGIVVDALMAPGVYEAARELGLAIPGDVAVIAHGEAPDARSLRPVLSAIRASHYECGRVGAEMLLDLITGRAREARVVYLEPTLDIRDSCGTHDVHGEEEASSETRAVGEETVVGVTGVTGVTGRRRRPVLERLQA
ncbi:MAG TPA: GntR family transcriptional regulator, partial [Chloroflexota bacterium]|nr:GntR family transcriptional regulator [Chloroflexota bacterium]